MWLKDVYRAAHELARLEFHKEEFYDLRPSREDMYRHWYRQLVETEFGMLTRPAAVDRTHIAVCVSTALVDWLFRDIRVRDRPYIGVRSRLDHWESPRVDTKGRKFVRRVPPGQKSSTRYGVPVKAPRPGNPGKSEVRSVADLADGTLVDLDTGEVMP